MRLATLLPVIDSLAPLRFAEGWDNVGLLVGDPEAEITRVLVTVDYSDAVAAEARELGAQLVVAYHPPMFAAVKRVPHDSLWADAVRRGIALYSIHTALDVAFGGTNDVLADAALMRDDARLPLKAWAAASPERDGPVGIGRIGDIAEPCDRRRLIERIKENLSLDHVIVSGPLDEPVRRVAVAAGAGGELLESAVRAGADVFVTGELRHHDAIAAARRGVTVIMTLHSNSERAGVRAFATRLAHSASDLVVGFSTQDRDPFSVV